MNELNRRVFCLSSISAAGALSLANPNLRAQSQSLELAKILVGFPAGAGVDVLARRIAERLAPSYARQVAYSTRSRTPFRPDGGQHSTVMADTVPR